MDIIALLRERLGNAIEGLTFERIVYAQEINKIFVYFKADRLFNADEKENIDFELVDIFRFSGVISVISTPMLVDDFIKAPNDYAYLIKTQIMTRLDAFSMNNSLDDLFLEFRNNKLYLCFKNSIRHDVFSDESVSSDLKKIVKDVFGLEVDIIIDNKTEADKKNEIKMKPELEKADSSVVLGKSFDDELTSIEALAGTNKKFAAIAGKLVFIETTTTKSDYLIVSMVISDHSGSIYCKAFLKDNSSNSEKYADIVSALKLGSYFKIKGKYGFDEYIKEPTISINSIMLHENIIDEDDAEEKRVELNAKTQMSLMDATVSASDLIKYAKKIGHKAIAITDNGCVQAFPEAFACAKKAGIKLIPGVEMNMVNGNPVLVGIDDRSINSDIVVFDLETTGLTPFEETIIEIGAVKIHDGMITESFQEFVNPGFPLPSVIVELTHITDSMLAKADKVSNVLDRFMAFVGDSVIAAHNAKFDCAFLRNELGKLGKGFNNPILDTLVLAQHMFPGKQSYRLGKLCEWLKVSLINAHRAIDDAAATGECLVKMLRDMKKSGVENLKEINERYDSLAKARKFKVSLLAINQTGMYNLNKIVSEAHLNYFNQIAIVPKSIIDENREGILVGSNASESELFEAIRYCYSDEAVKKIVDFYDYLEVQPVENHKLLYERNELKDRESVIKITKRIIELGKKHDKPVVATGEVHYIYENEKKYREVLQCSGRTKNIAMIQPSYHFRNTKQMLDEFSFLDKDLAYEIVVKNTQKIADMVEKISLYPEHPENKTTFSPLWETAADDIKTMSYQTAENYYGSPLPKVVEKRLEKELNSILGYGYATLYSIAQKLVENSLKNGYLVGSRGSVGSSLVATMCNITEVNPLPAHYRCSECKYTEFVTDSDIKVGLDLPEKLCPKCGKKLIQDGFDIPFEVFLGFKGDKVPDIDLNFSGDYQAKAHAYVEELFGKGYVFRAGTITGLQDKTAKMYVDDYVSLKEEAALDVGKRFRLSRAEQQELIYGCVGVRKTTGQHPGGMVILPKQYNINQFTAIQHPADDVKSDIITTHYDFASMHDILVKLDILGHDDPTMIYRLEKWTGVKYKDIPLNDSKVISLFSSPKALGVEAEDINNIKTGTLGVPEFGTPFVIGMLEKTKPSTMEELVRISGLSHGTDVWNNNAEDIIDNGIAKLNECICVRDDVMNYLISMGLKEKTAFDIMENVRKGKKLKADVDYVSEMNEHNVPEWLIESCKKIGYLFPKGHAVAYVTMALRIAWFKLYYPVEYYAAFFSIRAKAFNYDTMTLPIEGVRDEIRRIENKINDKTASEKEKNELKTLLLILEMKARGINLLPIDVYNSDVDFFLPEDGNIRCPFRSLANFGEEEALSIINARKQKFISIEDLQKRADKVKSKAIELLDSVGALKSIPRTNQISLF